MAGPNKKSLEQIYQKKTQLEHILLRPDSYIGSIQKSASQQWVLDDSGPDPKIVSKSITYVPGLYKIFDEILVNAADNKQRDSSMTTLKVTINAAANTITVWNNGRGIPVAVHAEHKMYIPEMIFGHLLTSSNYDDEEKKVVGGRNGYGAKLANIFSTEFTVETADSARKLLYRQTWSGNMGSKTEASITPYAGGGGDYTCVTFKPDLARFKMSSLDGDTVALLSKRVYDMGGVLGKGVTVWLNGAKAGVGSFVNYVALYAGDDTPKVWERVNSRWEVVVTVSDGVFNQVSFVNGICTTKGGQHVNYVADQVAAAVVEAVAKKEKGKGVEVKPAHVKNYLSIFVNCLVENPAFDSQTKDTLTTRVKDFGSTAELSDPFLKKVLGTGIVDRVLSFAKFKATAELQRAGGGKKGGSRMLDVPKLDDANMAGTAKGHECTLILTEGDSAKSLAIAGLSVVGRDRYGVFPLKGKLLNVREASINAIKANAEIQNIVKIMGLTYGKVYDEQAARALRYGHLMIMSDQDHDGSHIKGLVLNLLHHFWPSLLTIPSFLRQFITPIVKASKGKVERSFFTLPEYAAWKEVQVEAAGGVAPSLALRGWAIKYYKGLGTSTAVEARDYFSGLQRHALDFTMDVPEESGQRGDDLIDLAFSKKRADDRKTWLSAFVPGTHVDYDTQVMLVSDFINKELILFSMADNIRSIPSVMDGFKPAQRKVLFACFKRNLRVDIKVAQLAGYVSEHACYHHGEASLAGTIIGMAQDYVGANNIPLLVPSGQFGTRLQGGKDAASPRYVFTRIGGLTRALFHADDDALLNYLDDDGQSIEPSYYMPIIPMALVNGVEGIGTGWSTSVPAYNPRDIIAAVRARIKGDALPQLSPWYRGFTGTIVPKDATHTTFLVTGRASVEEAGEAHVMTITELPVGRWTQDYKQFLVGLMSSAADREKVREKEKGKGGGGAAGKAAAKPGKPKKPAAAAPKGKAVAAAQSPGGATGGKGRVAKGKAKAKKEDEMEEDGEEGAVIVEDDDDDFEMEVDEDSEEEFDDGDDDGGGGKKKRKGSSKPKSKATEDKDLLAAIPADQPLVKDFAENHTDTSVHFTVRTTPAAARLLATSVGSEEPCGSSLLRKVFKMEASISTSNMHLFDSEGRIKKYSDPREIVEEFFTIRLAGYVTRKQILLARLGEDVDRLSNRARFISAVIAGTLKLSNRKRADLLAELHDAGYKGFEPASGEEAGGDDGPEDATLSVGMSGSGLPLAALARRYGYLLNMPLLSLTSEKVAALKGELEEKEGTLAALKATPPTSLWLSDLAALEAALTIYEAEVAGDTVAAAKAAAAGKKAAAALKKAATSGKAGKAGGGSAGATKAKKAVKAKRSAAWVDSEGEEEGGMDEDDEEDEEEEEEYTAPKPKKAAPVAAKPSAAAKPAAPAPKPVAPPVMKPSPSSILARFAGHAAPAPAPRPSFVIDLDDSDEDMGLGLSLTQRVAMKASGGGGGGGAPAPPRPAAAAVPKRPAKDITGNKPEVAAPAVKKVAAGSAAATQPVKLASSKSAKPKAAGKGSGGGGGGDARPSRRAATKVSYREDSDGEEEEEDESEEEDDEEDEDF